MTLFKISQDEASESITGFTTTHQAFFDSSREPLPSSSSDGLAIKAQSMGHEDNVLISLIPPKAPDADIKHVPCDIVLVIDVSASMATEAPLPVGQEKTGLTILDLTKHAAKTIIETLNDGDRIGLISFSSVVKELVPLMSMTHVAKQAVLKKVDGLQCEAATNLWGGIKAGLAAFETVEEIKGNTRTVMVLTDGQPNFMCPGKGYIPSLRELLAKAKRESRAPVNINTFGFGYDIQSELLRSIAAVTGGSYAFIPGCEMIGTVFVHAVANLYSTYLSDVTLELKAPSSLHFEVSAGYEMRKHGEDNGLNTYRLPLSHLIYGQSRGLIVQIKPKAPGPCKFEIAVHSYTDGKQACSATKSFFIADTKLREVPYAEGLYHETRHKICTILSSIWVHEKENDRNNPVEKAAALEAQLKRHSQQVETLIQELKTLDLHDEQNQSLLGDLEGQIALALGRPDYFSRWGRHYLKSLFNAHQKQLCNSFKDPGPLLYGADSPLFVRCRDELNDVFDNLPPPTPSIPEHAGPVAQASAAFTPTSPGAVPLSLAKGVPSPSPFAPRTAVASMRSYNDRNAPCFAGHCPVLMANGSHSKVSALRPGMEVATLHGRAGRITAVVKTVVQDPRLCLAGEGLVITPWHPICLSGPFSASSPHSASVVQTGAEAKTAKEGMRWCFPDDVFERVTQKGDVDLFSVLLERHAEPEAHSIRVGGFWAVTLGHGHGRGNEREQALLQQGATETDGTEHGNVCAHPFLGDWDKVCESIESLERDGDGVAVSAGVVRDEKTGLACGFASSA